MSQVDVNLINSLDNWLRSHSKTAWAKEFGHSQLMITYADALQYLLFDESDRLMVLQEQAKTIPRYTIDWQDQVVCVEADGDFMKSRSVLEILCGK